VSPSRPAIGPQPKVFALRAKTDIAGRDGTVLAGAYRAARETVTKRQSPRKEPDELLQSASDRGTPGPSRPAIGPQPKVFALRAKTDIAGRDGTVLDGA
jgi:hypothetical protein